MQNLQFGRSEPNYYLPVLTNASSMNNNYSMNSMNTNTELSSFDNDFDFNMLSEYLFEDEKPYYSTSNNNMQSIPKGLQEVTSKTSDDLSDDEYDSTIEDDEDKQNGNRKGKGKSKDQVDRRRERNRVLARKTRLRKKFFFESLQKQVAQLALENEMLKKVVSEKLDNEVRNKILSECTAEVPAITTTEKYEPSALERADYSLMSAIQAAQRSFVLTDPSLPDNPIIFASKGFLELTGYRLNEVLGRNCRFLQGPGTDPKHVEELRNGVSQGLDTSVCLLNYKADGTQFYNQVFIAALRDVNNKIINYVGVQVEITREQMENADVVASKKAAEKVQECLTTSSNSASAALKLPKKSKGKVDTKPRAKKEAAKSPPHEQPQAKRSKRQNNAGDMIDD